MLITENKFRTNVQKNFWSNIINNIRRHTGQKFDFF